MSFVCHITEKKIVNFKEESSKDNAIFRDQCFVAPNFEDLDPTTVLVHALIS